MKKNLILLGLAGALVFGSCDKYLDVLPKTQMPETSLFNTEGGFKDALGGVYINATSGSTYGRQLTFDALERLVSSWDVTTGTLAQKLGLYNYADAEVVDLFNNIFSAQYKTIAHINQILAHLETNRNVLITKNMYELIKAECLSMRAYLHFDLMRLYGPMPLDPNNGNKLAYVTTFGKEVNPHISYEDYKAKVFQDLQDAEMLFKEFDPILDYSLPQLRRPNTGSFIPEDTFFSARPLRMNYYAVKALQARAHLWYGENDKALLAAQEVIDAKDPDGLPKFKLGTSVDFTAKNFTLIGEQIFGLYYRNMSNIYTSNFGSGTLRKSTSATIIKRDLYGNTGTDVREASTLWTLVTLSNGSNNYVITKYLPLDASVTQIDNDYKQIPMIRISEMYLIAAETAPFTEGVGYLKQFRAARNISQLADPTNPAELNTQLMREYRKEFYAEGQAFYAFKRTNAPKSQILFAPAAAVVNYVLPMPTVEVSNQ